MPKVRTDWPELLIDAGEPTDGWEVIMQLRPAAGQPAVAEFSTADGTMLVGQPTENGDNYGISVDASYTDMNFAVGTYLVDVMRTDGGRRTDLLMGAIWQWEFIEPITEPGVA